MRPEQEEVAWDDGVKGAEVPQLIGRNDRFIRVEAGPGTGKTFGLKKRVARLLHPRGMAIVPNKVLVVAFNRVIAADLRKEIKDNLASHGIENLMPVVKTVHGLCLEILGQDTRLLMAHERDAMVYDIVEENAPLKAQFARHGDAEQALKNHEAGHENYPLLWQAAQRWLERHAAQLISDLPGKLLDHVRGGDFPEARYKHILADEFQDLTSTQHRLLFALLEPDGNLMALGDRRQSIYRFLGNDPEGLARLDQLAGSPVIDLPMVECHRCPAPIIEAANRLMVASEAAPMQGGNDRPPNTHVVTWGSPADEAVGMARAIVDNIAANPDDKHLVMVPRKAFGFMLRDAISAIAPDQDVDLNFEEGLLEEWAVREAFLFFCLVTDPDPATWRAWFSYRNDSTGTLFLAGQRNAPSYLNLLATSEDAITEEFVASVARGDVTVRGTGSVYVRRRAERFVELKARLRFDSTEPDAALGILLAPDTWITPQYDAEKRVSALLDLDLLTNAATISLKNELGPAPVNGTTLKTLAKTLRAQIATRDVAHEPSENSLRITTLWSAKGVTANHVYVLGLCDEALPGGHRNDYPGTQADYLEEQRRLFYVTITRSKGTLVLSRATSVRFNDALRLGLAVQNGGGQNRTLLMSRFLRDIAGSLPTAEIGARWAGCEQR